MGEAYETLLVEREGPVAVVTLSRPPMNLINARMLLELEAVVARLESDDAVRVVVLTGAGDRLFSGGADLAGGFEEVGDLAGFLRRGHALLRRLETFPKPVVAALQGHALGGGCELALACHLRVMKETARIGQTESNLGLIPGLGGTVRLAELLGRPRAVEYLLLGTQLSAPEALAQGLVNRLAPEGETLAEARRLAHALAARPVATGLILRCVDRALTAPREEAFSTELAAFLEALRTEDAAEGSRPSSRSDRPVSGAAERPAEPLAPSGPPASASRKADPSRERVGQADPRGCRPG
ncbi:MAG: enoyl-CoA hydratase/isomerase family protein [Armatimonadota bacterium]|nr:enoyl-CoA hydratase/isomerase family protein [Armatimonadota bacterium]MDR7492268.1 enoyl-CoA hydratase/isomerase family protein [Armatimonadota bacterium]MDR7593208.1 enoyl-CoA hydratase/isomerase family protein [Armatimonadota bacterium]